MRIGSSLLIGSLLAIAGLALSGCDLTPPNVTSMSPTFGPAEGGTTVTLLGFNLGNYTDSVTVGGCAGTTLLHTGTTKLTFVTPKACGTSAVVTVTLNSPDGVVNDLTFTYIYTAPTVSSISARSGPTVGGTVLTIAGSHFQAPTLTVDFGTTLGIDVTTVSTTSFNVTTPGHRAGTVSVNVATVGGGATAGSFTYTYFVLDHAGGPRIASMRTGDGWWEVTADGSVRAVGAAQDLGTLPTSGIHVDDVVAIATTPSGGGYFLIGADGGVFAFGDALFHGSLPSITISAHDVVSVSLTPDGGGYYLVGADGGVFAFGDATFDGSLPSEGVAVRDVSDITISFTGSGYYLVGADGGVFAFGDATFDGSLPSIGLRAQDVVGIVGVPAGGGYYLVGADGGVFAFGDAVFHGSLGSSRLDAPITGIVLLPDDGYDLIATGGGASSFTS